MPPPSDYGTPPGCAYKPALIKLEGTRVSSTWKAQVLAGLFEGTRATDRRTGARTSNTRDGSPIIGVPDHRLPSNGIILDGSRSRLHAWIISRERRAQGGGGE